MTVETSGQGDASPTDPFGPGRGHGDEGREAGVEVPEDERPGRVRQWMHRAHEWREKVRSRRRTRVIYKTTVGVIGGIVVIGGLGLVPLPGPGWLVVFVGLGILASEFTWAHRLQQFAKRHVQAWTHWLGRQHWPMRAFVGLVTFGCVAVTGYGLLVVTGVPTWVPAAIVPPLPGLDG